MRPFLYVIENCDFTPQQWPQYRMTYVVVDTARLMDNLWLQEDRVRVHFVRHGGHLGAIGVFLPTE